MTDVSVSSDSEKEEEFKNGDEKGEINKKLEISSLKGKLSNFSEILLKSLKKQLLHKRHSRKSKRGSLEFEKKIRQKDQHLLLFLGHLPNFLILGISNNLKRNLFL